MSRRGVAGGEVAGWRAALLGAALALGACKGSSPGAGGGEGPEVAQQQLTTKLNIYVACLNNVNPAVHYSRERYLGWADPARGPSMDGAGQGVIKVDRASTYGYECFERNGGIDGALSSAPKLAAIDAAGAEYRKAITAVMEATQKAATYYDHGDYKDDRLAQGKALHGPLMEAFGAFDLASERLSIALDELQDQLAVQELAKLEKQEGKQARWHHRNLMRLAGLMLRELEAADEVDLSKVTPAIDAFTSAFTELRAWTAQHQAEADKIVSWSSFIDYADGLAIELKELWRAFRDHKKQPESGAGSREQIIAKFNQLVDSSNGLWD